MAEQDPRGIAIVSAGTDGEDGPTDAAGAIVDETVIAQVKDLGLDAADFLHRNDAYNFFAPLGDLIVPGPTFTNVNDFRALLVL